MEQRKIIGYKIPFAIELWDINKGDLFTYQETRKNTAIYETYNSNATFPKQIVETWEPVYEEEKLEIIEWDYYKDMRASQIIFKGKITQEIIDKINEVI